jgi:hypothetical protein
VSEKSQSNEGETIFRREKERKNMKNKKRTRQLKSRAK